ncbi:MAG: hypothetical protein HC918_05670 [Oscillatoriales cyanobacterium SM2_1_8]|nr:hypothetical protein [Oscillatoriales cyanobacterium SM2_1_8]
MLEPAIFGLLAVDVGMLTVTINKAYQAQKAGARARQQQEEEETLTRYEAAQPASGYPQGGWEFKIVRSSFRRFRYRHVLQAVCEEEAQSGWILLEKLDDERLRFRRPVAFRANDRLVARDSYRTLLRPPGRIGLLAVFALFADLAGFSRLLGVHLRSKFAGSHRSSTAAIGPHGSTAPTDPTPPPAGLMPAFVRLYNRRKPG